jgi:hypothetical protein
MEENTTQTVPVDAAVPAMVDEAPAAPEEVTPTVAPTDTTPTPEEATPAVDPAPEATPETQPEAPVEPTPAPEVPTVTPDDAAVQQQSTDTSEVNNSVQPDGQPYQEQVPDVIETTVRVVFEGQHVSAVLHDGKELRDSSGKITHYHCSLEDGTTKHVPVELFK